jgi:5-methylcytosine-specific restriction protein B
MSHADLFALDTWGKNVDERSHEERALSWLGQLTGFVFQAKQFRHTDDTDAYRVMFGNRARVSGLPASVKLSDSPGSFSSKQGVGAIFISLLGNWSESEEAVEDLGARYIGTSLVFFPCYAQTDDETRATRLKQYSSMPSGILVCLGMGTGGAGPDEQLVSSPGHVRRFSGMVRSLGHLDVDISPWWRSEPLAQKPVPNSFISRVQRYLRAFPYALGLREGGGGYGQYLYAVAAMKFGPGGDLDTQQLELLNGFTKFYLRERGWHKDDADDPARRWYSTQFPPVSKKDVVGTLSEEKYVILCGPPGTRKTDILQQVSDDYGSRAIVCQFHPSTTYQSFVGGIQPSLEAGADANVQFGYYMGPLLRAIRRAKDSPGEDILLAIDELNRADLPAVLGEAIQLLEPTASYSLSLKDYNRDEPFTMPDNLLVLATMNTADRNIAHIDVAVRRRFAFLNIWPSEPAGEDRSCDYGKNLFSRCRELFLEYGDDGDLQLMPGGFYFLGGSETAVKESVRLRLVPLISDYLLENRLSGRLQDELSLFLQDLERQLL